MNSRAAEIELSNPASGMVVNPGRTLVGEERAIRRHGFWLWRAAISLALVLGAGVLIVTASDGFVGDDLTSQDVANIMLARQIVLSEIVTNGNAEHIDTVVAPDAQISVEDERWVGPAGMRQLISWLDAQAPDRLVLVDAVEPLGDRIIVDGRMTGSFEPGFLNSMVAKGQGAVNVVFTLVVTDGQLTLFRIDPAVA